MAISIEEVNKESWFKIPQSDAMRPFLMSLVSDSNHWMFISSNGGLTAGRKDVEGALFPYYTDDKLTEMAHTTGSKSIFQVERNGGVEIWEPFSGVSPLRHGVQRNLYKNRTGNKVMFEEINMDLGLQFSYTWNSSNLFGFVRQSALVNTSGSLIKVKLIDGIQNVLTYGVNSDLQRRQSNLVDAYKRTELAPESGMGIFALSAIIVDRAEPSEALKANVSWSLELENPKHLLSSLQLEKFRKCQPITQETDAKGEQGAYFLLTELTLAPYADTRWTIMANVNQTQADMVDLSHRIKRDPYLAAKVEADIALGTENLLKLVAGADGLTYSSDPLRDTRHYANVLFNIMRGGIFDENYLIEKKEFGDYLRKANAQVAAEHRAFIDGIETRFDLASLHSRLDRVSDPDFQRLCREYLPLKFSRRHGDPSRPWNRFSINIRSEIDGSKILDYEGNWRDIFQNWEALVHAYPAFVEGMIYKFLNASTFDGYNPYRITKSGFDWEVVEPDDPWSFIGYWGDHQIIYLLKFLEFHHGYDPRGFSRLLKRTNFVFANVPYRIKPYDEIVENPKDTIDFDKSLDHTIRLRVAENGADGALLGSKIASIHRVNFIEKILVTVLAKVSNFVPDAGIWLNTQRPEWNDANNALVGNGVSMVTLNYLRRFLKFFEPIFERELHADIEVSEELLSMFSSVKSILESHRHLLSDSISHRERKNITEGLGRAGSAYREMVYKSGYSGTKASLTPAEMRDFVEVVLQYLEHSIRANRRTDGLYHAYNLISFDAEGISVGYLSEMLEGQVAALSASLLSPEEALQLLDALRASALYRPDQMSYMLYPNKQLPGFLQKNIIPTKMVHSSELFMAMEAQKNNLLINRDVDGNYHFNGDFKNASDLVRALETLQSGTFAELAAGGKERALQIFEAVFHHKSFTGRSGTFFAYEGLGSIYWHMVSKLCYAVMEVCQNAVKEGANPATLERLFAHFDQISEGIGLHKDPKLYGVFPTDPYSHTPWHRGAQQPGMTGQVKEDILVRMGELGVSVEAGKLQFAPFLLKGEAFLKASERVELIAIDQRIEEIELPEASLAFTCCQVLIIYQVAGNEGLELTFHDGTSKAIAGLELDAALSNEIFMRTGKVTRILVHLHRSRLR